MRAAFLALGLGALLAPAALAQETLPAPGSAPAAAPAKPGDRIICGQVTVSGSRIPLPNKCMTKRDWDTLAGRGKEDIESAIRSSLTRNVGIGG